MVQLFSIVAMFIMFRGARFSPFTLRCNLACVMMVSVNAGATNTAYLKRLTLLSLPVQSCQCNDGSNIGSRIAWLRLPASKRPS